MAGTVGCGSHTGQIIDRDGAVVTDLNVLTSVEWTRVLDDVSTANVGVIPDGDCCESLGNVRTWRHRLVISRDGEVVWDGPVIRVEWRQGQVSVFALDITAWLDRRVPHQDFAFADTDLTVIAEELIEDAFAPDDPGHTVTVIGQSGIEGGREYTAGDGQTGDHLRDLADTGLDYTAVGSTIILLPEDFEDSVGMLTDADMPSGLVVAEDGSLLATRVVVHGSEASGVVGEAGGTDTYYGLLERSVDEDSITTDTAAASSARAIRAANFPVPLFLATEEITLSPDAAVEVAALVPGWCVDIASNVTCRPLAQRLKIIGVKVEESGTEGESVQVVLAPLSSLGDNTEGI